MVSVIDVLSMLPAFAPAKPIGASRPRSRDRYGYDRTSAQIAAFVQRLDLPFTIWHDSDDRTSSLAGARTLPISLLIGADGKIRWRRDGVIDVDDRSLADAIQVALDDRGSGDVGR